jgi:hypothetical protein
VQPVPWEQIRANAMGWLKNAHEAESNAIDDSIFL